jgi:hypothetical protein
MNTHKLGKQYNRLTARERGLLIVAASSRGDAVERERLLASAPRLTYETPHHVPFARALAEASDMHLMNLLNLAAQFWQWWGLWGWHGQRLQAGVGAQANGKKQSSDAQEVRMHHMTRYQAYLFVTHVDGWNRFCAELPLDPQALLGFMPGWDTVARTEIQARDCCFSRDDAAMFLLDQRFGKEGPSEESVLPQVVTSERLVADWHIFFNRRAK